MKSLRVTVWVPLVALSVGAALAQPASRPTPGAGPGASAPGMGMGPGAARGAARWGAKDTPGWALMTPAERDEHRQRMLSMTSYDECKAYQAQHHEQMVARAKERGAAALPPPRRDPCGALKK